MNRRRIMTGVHLKGRVVLIDELPEGIDNSNAFFWKPNGPKHETSAITNTGNYNNTVDPIYIPIDESGNFDYKYNTFVTNIDGAFSENTNIKELYFDKVEGLDHCESGNALFKNCTNLEQLNIDGFNTSNWKRIAGILYNCSSLKSIDFSRVDLQNVFDITYYWYNNKPFYGCSNITYINCGTMFDKGVWTIAYMFNCKNLKQIDNFFNKKLIDKSTVTQGVNVLDWRNAFDGCGLEILDFRNMDFSAILPENTDRESGLYLQHLLKWGPCKEVHFPDVRFRITSWYAFGDSDNSVLRSLEYLNLGGAYYSDIVSAANNVEYMFTYASKLNKIRCLQETKDYLIANSSLAWLPSKFKTNDSLWEIVELT